MPAGPRADPESVRRAPPISRTSPIEVLHRANQEVADHEQHDTSSRQSAARASRGKTRRGDGEPALREPLLQTAAPCLVDLEESRANHKDSRSRAPCVPTDAKGARRLALWASARSKETDDDIKHADRRKSESTHQLPAHGGMMARQRLRSSTLLEEFLGTISIEQLGARGV